jgi:hypothetical protein
MYMMYACNSDKSTRSRRSVNMPVCCGGDQEYMQDILKMEPLLQSLKPECAGMRRLSRMALGEPKVLNCSWWRTGKYGWGCGPVPAIIRAPV